MILHSANHPQSPGAFRKAFDYYTELKASSLIPSTTTFTSLLSLCCKLYNVEQITYTLSEMRTFGVQPSARAIQMILDLNENAKSLSDEDKQQIAFLKKILRKQMDEAQKGLSDTLKEKEGEKEKEVEGEKKVEKDGEEKSAGKAKRKKGSKKTLKKDLEDSEEEVGMVEEEGDEGEGGDDLSSLSFSLPAKGDARTKKPFALEADEDLNTARSSLKVTLSETRPRLSVNEEGEKEVGKEVKGNVKEEKKGGGSRRIKVPIQFDDEVTITAKTERAPRKRRAVKSDD